MYELCMVCLCVMYELSMVCLRVLYGLMYELMFCLFRVPLRKKSIVLSMFH
jgi:hypothetical protein